MLYYERTANGAAISVVIAIIFVFSLTLSAMDIAAARGENPFDRGIIVLGSVIFALALNFTFLTTKITPENMVVRYGLFKHVVNWDDIRSYDVKVYERRFRFEPLWGLSIGSIKGRSELGYVTYFFRRPQVVTIEQKRGRFDFFTFSTKHPE
jgi:hypothetical protein